MIDALLAGLQRDAEAEIARATEAARTEAAAIAAAADSALTRRRAEALERLEGTRREALTRALGAARRAARDQVLAARARLLTRVFDALAAALPQVAQSEAYRAALPGDVGRALAFAGDRTLEVRCAPALAPLLDGVVQQNGRLTMRPDPAMPPGFRVTTTDDAPTLAVDGTLAGRIERLRPRLAIAALEALEPRAGDEA